jgi:signal transduction histidine kinase
MRMVMELAKSGPGGEAMALDAELASMLRSSVEELIKLAEDLQELSWIERGKIAVGRGPGNLRAAFHEAVARLHGRVAIAGPEPPSLEGPWDEGRLVGVIEAFALAANRCGEGVGEVETATEERDGEARLAFRSGDMAGEVRAVDSDLGFPFFRAGAVALAMGGRVDVDRRQRACRIVLRLPR